MKELSNSLANAILFLMFHVEHYLGLGVYRKMFHVEHFLKAVRLPSDKWFDMVKSITLLPLLLLLLSGCRKPIDHPESVDPVYRDLKKEANKAFGAYKEREKATAEAKKAFDEAPIRTGLRLEAQEEYFEALHKQEAYAQKYRYYAIKAELRQKYDAVTYPKYFQEKKLWPDQEQFQEYQVEKRLLTAPREWNPENRIKQRELASSENKKQQESAEHE